MNKYLIAAAAAVFMAMPVAGVAAAGTIGGFDGGSSSASLAGSLSFSGGVTGNGMSSSQTDVFANNSSGAAAVLQSTNTFNHHTGVRVTGSQIVTSTFVEGASGSKTVNHTSGFGTAAFGGGAGVQSGNAMSEGGFNGFASTGNWWGY